MFNSENRKFRHRVYLCILYGSQEKKKHCYATVREELLTFYNRHGAWLCALRT